MTMPSPFALPPQPAAPITSAYSADEMLANEQRELKKQERKAPTYWAADAPDKVIAELERKERRYFEVLRRKGFVSMWRTIIAQWHGQDPSGTGDWATQTIALDGDRGELLRFRVNETRSFVKQLITMAIGQRPAFECGAINTDYASLGQAEAADSIINYLYWDRYGEKKERKTVTRGVLLGMAWSWVNWDPFAGEWVTRNEPVMATDPQGQPVVDPATGQPVQRIDPRTGEPMVKKVRTGARTGEITLKSLYPWEGFQEPDVEEEDEHLWWVGKERRSRHELIARYPEHHDKLMSEDADEFSFEKLFGIDTTGFAAMASDDKITVRHFYHLPSDAFQAPDASDPSAPDFRSGRYLMYAGGTCLRDVPLPYDELPRVDFCPAEYFGTSFGYADAWDLCALNQMLDEMYSIVASNLSAFGRQSVAIEEGTDYSADQIANGMNVFTVRHGAVAPAGVQLSAIPAAAQWFIGSIMERIQSLSSLNSVARGNPSANISSGQMAALFHSIAIEANSALSTSVDSHRERLANKMLNMIRMFANEPLIAKIAGVDERAYLETFTKDAFKDVKGAVVKTANPMMRSTSGKMQLAEMLQKVEGAIQDPQQLVEVLVSGQLKPLYDAPRKVRLRIRYENETLMQGPPIQTVTPPPPQPMPDGTMPPAPAPYEVVPAAPVLLTDDHLLHIREHAAMFSNPEAIKNEAVRKANEAHLRHHFKVWRETDPAITLALGHQPFQPAPMPAGMPQQQPANDNAQQPHGKQKPPPKQAPQSPQGGQLQAGHDVDLPHAAQPPPGSAANPANAA